MQSPSGPSEANQIMEILDKNKEHISDNDYLVMCNLLKEIHNKLPVEEKAHSLIKVMINPFIVDIVREYADTTPISWALDFIDEHIVVINSDNDEDDEDCDAHGEIIDLILETVYKKLSDEAYKKIINKCGGELRCRKMMRNSVTVTYYNKLIKNKNKKYYECLAMHGIGGDLVTFRCKCNDVLTEDEKKKCMSFRDFIGNMEEILREINKEEYALAEEEADEGINQ